jgi:twitching motility protein PilT
MRRVLRQDPDVVLLGEMRDLETISAAITAAETGHLVFGTLHTTGTARTVDRIIDAFPKEQQEQVRAQLSLSIIAVVSQVLVPRKDKGGVVAAFEIMINTPAIENYIRKGETFKITSDIQTGKKRGMMLLDENLVNLYREGKISADSAIEYSTDPTEMRTRLA